MKATIEFDLNDSDDRANHKRAVYSDQAYSALYEIDQKLRNIIKHQPEGFFDKDNFIKTIEDIRAEIADSNLHDLYT